MTDGAYYSELAELAGAYGVATEYADWRGETVAVPADTLVAALGALGVHATSLDGIRRAKAEARLAPWRRLLPPATVIRGGRGATVPVRAPEDRPVRAWIELEDGRTRRDLLRLAVRVEPVRVDGELIGETTLQTPEDLPLGWHRLHARCDDRQASAALVVTPAYLGLPERMNGRRTWGLTLQLYSVRSSASWGMGDLDDLGRIAELSARQYGAGMALVNPLHASEPVPPIEPSPYFPSSRRYADPLYLRIEDIPEFALLQEAERARVQALAEPLREANHTTALLDRDAVWRAKKAALESLFRVEPGHERRAAFASFRALEGRALLDFATWCALAERHGLPWQSWPAQLHDPDSPAVAAQREELAERVEFHAWLQYLLDEQLAATDAAARDAGMPVGIVHDLAVGVSPGGADAWRLGDTLARGVTAGAPPDAFNQRGQDWGQPPWRPDRLAEAEYAPLRDMLRFVLRHAGGLRVDHILGLFRLWWIPEGAPASAGTYVRYDHEALIGILALEAYRAGALVIGEDLGTVEAGVREYLSERGLLGTSLLWFETGRGGKPLPPRQWRELCLATVGTHDMPPIAGYLAGDHLELRERLGLLARPAAAERADDEASRRAWMDWLREFGLLLADTAVEADRWEVVAALHAFLTRTPARLIGVALTDVVGERRTQNQPGTVAEYPNWRVPLADGSGRPVLLEDLQRSSGLAELARIVSADAGP